MGPLVSTAGAGGPLLEWGVASANQPGQRTSGDGHIVREITGGVLIAVVDGLGHGEEAAVATARALQAVVAEGSPSVIVTVRRCHEALLNTRGVVMSVAFFNAADNMMSWLAIGNVDGILHRADPNAVPGREAIITRGGVVGLRLPLLQAVVTSVAPGDVLVLATDGVRSSFQEKVPSGSSPQRLADQLLEQYANRTDDALVFVARYLGREGPQS